MPDQLPTQRGWGGARPGSGRPPRALRLDLIPMVREQLIDLAYVRREPIRETAIACLAEGLIVLRARWLEEFQAEQQRQHSEREEAAFEQAQRRG